MLAVEHILRSIRFNGGNLFKQRGKTHLSIASPIWFIFNKNRITKSIWCWAKLSCDINSSECDLNLTLLSHFFFSGSIPFSHSLEHKLESDSLSRSIRLYSVLLWFHTCFWRKNSACHCVCRNFCRRQCASDSKEEEQKGEWRAVIFWLNFLVIVDSDTELWPSTTYKINRNIGFLDVDVHLSHHTCTAHSHTPSIQHPTAPPTNNNFVQIWWLHVGSVTYGQCVEYWVFVFPKIYREFLHIM